MNFDYTGHLDILKHYSLVSIFVEISGLKEFYMDHSVLYCLVPLENIRPGVSHLENQSLPELKIVQSIYSQEVCNGEKG